MCSRLCGRASRRSRRHLASTASKPCTARLWSGMESGAPRRDARSAEDGSKRGNRGCARSRGTSDQARLAKRPPRGRRRRCSCSQRQRIEQAIPVQSLGRCRCNRHRRKRDRGARRCLDQDTRRQRRACRSMHRSRLPRLRSLQARHHSSHSYRTQKVLVPQASIACTRRYRTSKALQ